MPRPLGTTQPPRNYYHLPARPDLGDVQAGLQPLGHASQATAARGGMSEPWMPDESRPAATCAARAPRHNETTRNHPGVRGGGEAIPTRHPKPPPTTLSHSACRPELETGGRGEGGQSRSPGAGQREWDLPIPAPGRRTPHAYRCWPPTIQAIAEQHRRAYRPWAGAPGRRLHWITSVWVRRSVECGGVIGNP